MERLSGLGLSFMAAMYPTPYSCLHQSDAGFPNITPPNRSHTARNPLPPTPSVVVNGVPRQPRNGRKRRPSGLWLLPFYRITQPVVRHIYHQPAEWCDHTYSSRIIHLPRFAYLPGPQPRKISPSPSGAGRHDTGLMLSNGSDVCWTAILI